MSHWVTSAALWESDPPRLLLQIGDGLWSSEEIAWSADSRIVTVGLRRYPGDAPGIVIEIYPECLVHDAGRTVLPAGTITCLGLGPAPAEIVDRLTGGLSLV